MAAELKWNRLKRTRGCACAPLLSAARSPADARSAQRLPSSSLHLFKRSPFSVRHAQRRSRTAKRRYAQDVRRRREASLDRRRVVARLKGELAAAPLTPGRGLRVVDGKSRETRRRVTRNARRPARAPVRRAPATSHKGTLMGRGGDGDGEE